MCAFCSSIFRLKANESAENCRKLLSNCGVVRSYERQARQQSCCAIVHPANPRLAAITVENHLPIDCASFNIIVAILGRVTTTEDHPCLIFTSNHGQTTRYMHACITELCYTFDDIHCTYCIFIKRFLFLSYNCSRVCISRISKSK